MPSGAAHAWIGAVCSGTGGHDQLAVTSLASESSVKLHGAEQLAEVTQF